jgi:hypothetical protein
MKKRVRHRVVQASTVLRQIAGSIAAGATMTDAIRCASISEKVFHQWRAEYGCFELDQIERIKEMEVENRRLQRTAYDLTRYLKKLDLKDAEPRPNRSSLIDRLESGDGLISIDCSETDTESDEQPGRGVPEDYVKHLETLRIENHRLRQTVANLTLQKLIRSGQSSYTA